MCVEFDLLFSPLGPFGPYLGFVEPPSTFYVAFLFIASAYFLLVQFVKGWFVRRFEVV